tara:strand:+ start:51 stop:311 length:261 start_codon:yes stop_codon:yes gene_type:complete
MSDRPSSSRDNAPLPRRRGGNSEEERLPRPPPPQSEETGKTKKPDDTADNSFKKGGKVKKTGSIKAHKGELVLPADLVKKLQMLMK